MDAGEVEIGNRLPAVIEAAAMDRAGLCLERRGQPDRVEDLQRAGIDREGAGFLGRLRALVDDAAGDAAPFQEQGGGEACRPRPHDQWLPVHGAALTRQIVLPTSSAISNAPDLSKASPTGRPCAVPSGPRKPVTTSSALPEGFPSAKGMNTTL